MRKLLVLSMIFSLFVLSGCIAPLSSNFSGRSLGKGKMGLEGVAGIGEVRGSRGFKLTYGTTSHLDIGIQLESFTVGLFGKYSFINTRENGFSLAALSGLGATVNGMYVYMGPVFSYKANFFEPYLVGRYNYVHYGETKDICGDTIEAGSYSYFQLTFGSIFWISRKIGLSFELSTLSGSTEFLDFDGPIFMGGLKLNF